MTTPVKITFTILLLVLLTLVGFTAFKLFTTAVDNTDYMSRGDNYFNQKEYSNALFDYQRLVNRDPNNLVLYSKIAKIYEIKNRYKDAIDILEKGISKKQDDPDLNYQLAEDCAQLFPSDASYLDKAYNGYLNAAKIDKYKDIATYKSARILSIKGDTDDLNRAKDIYTSLGDYAPAKYELVLYNLDNPDQTLSALAEAQKITATSEQDSLVQDFATWTDFGKNISDQVNVLKQDIAAKKSAATVFDSKGYVAYKVNRCEFGINFFKNAITESEKEVFYPQARLLLGECLKRLYKYEDAKNYLEPVYANVKDSIEVRLVLRHVYRGLGDYTNMKKMYEELITLDGQNMNTRFDYANDLESLPENVKTAQDWNTIAAQYEWLGMNLQDKVLINSETNTNYSLNQKFLIKAFGVYTYKVKDYQKAESLIKNALAVTDKKLIDPAIGNELVAWSEYMQNTGNKDLETSVYNQAKDLTNTDAEYHTAYIALKKGDKETAKNKALAAYDGDENGYIGPLAADIVNGLEK